MSTPPRLTPGSLAVTLGLGTIGGVLGWMLALPLPWLLGALLTTALVAQSGWHPLGQRIALPSMIRARVLPIIGVAIGAAFTPEVLGQLSRWWPTALALAAFLPVALASGYAVFRLAGLPRLESVYGALPGGMIESTQLAEEAGADPATVTMLHLVRIVTTLVAIPPVFFLLTGDWVGRGSGMVLPGAAGPATVVELALLLVIAATGYVMGIRLRLPAAHLVGPMILAAVAYGMGVVSGVPPDWLIAAAQVIVGCGLGARFAGVPRRLLARVSGLSLVNTVILIGLALGLAALMGPIVGEPAATIFLAFAPGGLPEMSLIALSVGVSIPFVMSHHLLRLVLSLLIARFVSRRLKARRGD